MKQYKLSLKTDDKGLQDSLDKIKQFLVSKNLVTPKSTPIADVDGDTGLYEVTIELDKANKDFEKFISELTGTKYFDEEVVEETKEEVVPEPTPEVVVDPIITLSSEEYLDLRNKVLHILYKGHGELSREEDEKLVTLLNKLITNLFTEQDKNELMGLINKYVQYFDEVTEESKEDESIKDEDEDEEYPVVKLFDISEDESIDPIEDSEQDDEVKLFDVKPEISTEDESPIEAEEPKIDVPSTDNVDQTPAEEVNQEVKVEVVEEPKEDVELFDAEDDKKDEEINISQELEDFKSPVEQLREMNNEKEPDSLEELARQEIKKIK